MDLAGRAAGVAWSDDRAGHDDWIVIDRSAGADVWRDLVSDESQLLWYEASQADDVWAILAELRGRDETRRILVVRRVEAFAAVDSAEIAALARLCRNYHATLLVVVQVR